MTVPSTATATSPRCRGDCSAAAGSAGLPCRCQPSQSLNGGRSSRSSSQQHSLSAAAANAVASSGASAEPAAACDVEWDGWSTSSAASSPVHPGSVNFNFCAASTASAAEQQPDASEGLRIAGTSMARAAGGGEHPLDHCWAPAKASSFMVRRGPNYKKRGLKGASAAALYEVVGVDAFACGTRKADGVAQRVLLPEPAHPSPHASIPSIIIVNAQLPLEAPSMVSPSLDGPTLQCVFYMALSAEAASALAAGGPLPPALQLLEEYCSKAEGDQHTRWRFKAMARINNLHDAGLPGPVVQNNGRPTLITKSGTVITGVARTCGGGTVRYLELDCNVRHWCFLARRALKHLLPKAPRVHLSIAFVIEGRHDAELPEQVLGCCELGGLDPDRAVELAP